MWAHLKWSLKRLCLLHCFHTFWHPQTMGWSPMSPSQQGGLHIFLFFFFWRSCAEISCVPLKWLFRFEAMVAIEVSLLVRGCLGLAVWSWIFFAHDSLFLIPDLLRSHIHLSCVLKYVVPLYTLFWMKEVAIKSCPGPRTYLGLKNEERAGAGAPSAPPGDGKLWHVCIWKGSSEQ